MFTSLDHIDHLVQKAQDELTPKHLYLETHTERLHSITQQRVNYYRFLYHLMERKRPMTALELGVEYGLASAYMYMAGYGYTTLIGVDLHGLSTFDGHLFPPANVFHHFIEGDSTDDETIGLVRDIVMDRGKIGIVFQDSSHHYEASKQEFAAYSPMLAENAIWICDDVMSCFHDPQIDPPGKSMETYFDELPGQHVKYKDVLHYGNVMGIALL